MLLHKTGIYAIENVLNGRVYVGATKAGLSQRWKTHLLHLHRRSHDFSSLRHDAEIFGSCAFRCVLLQELPSTVPMVPLEQFWIDYFRRLGVNCYNINPAIESWFPRRRVHPVPPEYRYTIERAGYYCRRVHQLSISVWRLRRDVKVGLLPALFDGFRWYFHPDDLDRYCAKYEQRTSGPWGMRRRLTITPGAPDASDD